MSDLAIIINDIEQILSLCTEAEKEFILNYLTKSLEDDKRKKEPIQNGK